MLTNRFLTLSLINILTFSMTGCQDPDSKESDQDQNGQNNGSSDDTAISDPSGAINIVEQGNCLSAEALSNATPNENAASYSVSIEWWPQGNVAAIIRSQEELDAFMMENEVFEIDNVDFDNIDLLIAGVNVGSTCGIDDPSRQLLEVNGSPYLQLEVENTGALCTEVCDMAWAETMAYAVPKADNAQVCARLIETCEE